MSGESVVLIPGIALFGLELIPLRRRLRREGYDAHIFFYSAWHNPLEACVKRFEGFLQRVAPGGAHVVCHSLGAQAARNLARFSLTRWILGRDLLSALDGTPFRLPSNVEMGSIAGSLDPLLGWLWGLRRPNDGLVCVDETLHPDAVDALTIASTHSSILASKTVADHVVRFLKRSRFAQDRAAPR